MSSVYGFYLGSLVCGAVRDLIPLFLQEGLVVLEGEGSQDSKDVQDSLADQD